VNQVLVKVIADEDQNRLPTGTLQRSLQAIPPERETTKLRGLSALRMTQTNRDESLRVLLRLLIDESVEDLSQSGNGCASLPGEAHEAKETLQTLLGMRPGHDVDVAVNFLP
jgi:hypothetical protein